MQAVSVLPFSDISGKFVNDFAIKLRVCEGSEEDREHNDEVETENEEEEEEEEEEEFSFAFASPISPVSADDVFDNGQIRPVYPLFNQDLLFSDESDGGAGILPPVKKVFVPRRDDSPTTSSASSSTTAAADPEGEYCEWRPNMAVKSNSTGFSKIWKLRDHKLRSNSDGKDAFVFLNPVTVLKAERAAEKARSGEGIKGAAKKVNNNVAKKGKTTSSSLTATEKHYVNNRARKESDKRKSYLPYKQELFGFFAPTNGLSRNVHPY